MASTASTVGLGLKRILVAVDFTQSSRKAIEHGAMLARACGAKLYLAHVVSSLAFTLSGPESIAMAGDAAREDISRLENELLASGLLKGISHESIVRQGNVGEQLETVVEQEHIDMIVVGSHGHAGLGKIASVAEEIFRRVSCPVLTVGPCVPSKAASKN